MNWQQFFYIDLYAGDAYNRHTGEYHNVALVDKKTEEVLSYHRSEQAAEQAAERRFKRLMKKIEKQVFG